MKIISVEFANSARAYSYYCSLDDVSIGDELLSPDGKVVTVVKTDVDPASIPANIMAILKTITERAEAVPIAPESRATTEPSAAAQTDLITVVQLPVIEDQLRSVKEAWDGKLRTALSLPCSRETVSTIKTIRADMRKEFFALDDRRKEIKEIASAPIRKFEATFKDCISDPFTKADVELKEKIDTVEDGLRDKKRVKIEAHYNERLASLGLDFPTFAQAGIKVGLSDTESSLIKQVDEFTARIARDIDAIKDLPFADEIIVEYKSFLDASAAIKMVNARHKAMEEVRVKMDVTPVSAPSIPVPPPAVPRVIVSTNTEEKAFKTFRVTGSDRKIDALVRFLEDGWYEYEVIG
ncbi:MAG: DUF1351 domain-containing protein [Christensenella sp.]|nr:DUF1351 domain-containing protein [Christensenella sp.]